MATLKEIAPGCAHLNDAEFVDAFEKSVLRPEWFHHADHVRLAWLYVTQHDYAAAEKRFHEGLVKLAAHFGVPEKFHFTMTMAWLRAVQVRIAGNGETSFVRWIGNHLELLDRDFLLNYYSKDRLAGAEARAGWLDPDRKALCQTAR